MMNLRRFRLIARHPVYTYKCLIDRLPLTQDNLEIYKAIKDLKSDDKGIKLKAVYALRKAAENGTSITTAVSALRNELKNKDSWTRKNAMAVLILEAVKNESNLDWIIDGLGGDTKTQIDTTWALQEILEKYCSITDALETAVVRAMSIQDLTVRQNATMVLVWAIIKRTDITSILESFVKALETASYDLKHRIAFMLNAASKNEKNISEIIPSIIDLLKSTTIEDLRPLVFEILVVAIRTEANRQKVFEGLAKILKDNDRDAKHRAIMILDEALKQRLDISIAISALINALKDHTNIQGSAEITLNHAIENGINVQKFVPEFIELLKTDVRPYAIKFLLKLELNEYQAKQILALTKDPIDKQLVTDLALLTAKSVQVLDGPLDKAA